MLNRARETSKCNKNAILKDNLIGEGKDFLIEKQKHSIGYRGNGETAKRITHFTDVMIGNDKTGVDRGFTAKR